MKSRLRATISNLLVGGEWYVYDIILRNHPEIAKDIRNYVASDDSKDMLILIHSIEGSLIVKDYMSKKFLGETQLLGVSISGKISFCQGVSFLF